MKASVQVPLVALVGLGAFVVWASGTNRLSLWSARFGAWVRKVTGEPAWWYKS